MILKEILNRVERLNEKKLKLNTYDTNRKLKSKSSRSMSQNLKKAEWGNNVRNSTVIYDSPEENFSKKQQITNEISTDFIFKKSKSPPKQQITATFAKQMIISEKNGQKPIFNFQYEQKPSSKLENNKFYYKF